MGRAVSQNVWPFSGALSAEGSTYREGALQPGPAEENSVRAPEMLNNG